MPHPDNTKIICILAWGYGCHNQKIACIKDFRNVFNVNFKAAKDSVEKMAFWGSHKIICTIADLGRYMIEANKPEGTQFTLFYDQVCVTNPYIDTTTMDKAFTVER